MRRFFFRRVAVPYFSQKTKRESSFLILKNGFDVTLWQDRVYYNDSKMNVNEPKTGEEELKMLNSFIDNDLENNKNFKKSHLRPF